MNNTYTWSGYRFGQFSNWVSAFVVGKGKVTVRSGGSKLLEVDEIPLTPGPLVIALKCYVGVGGCVWPPSSSRLGFHVETIAASFRPLAEGQKVRLFNLAPDVAQAGLAVGANATALAAGVKYSLGSEWVPAPDGARTYAATDDAGAAVASAAYGEAPAR